MRANYWPKGMIMPVVLPHPLPPRKPITRFSMKRPALALGLFLTPLAGWAAYNQIPPGAVAQSSLGANVFNYLQNAADSATGFVSAHGLATGVQTTLATALDAAGGLVSYSALSSDVQVVLGMTGTVASAIQNATNAANGLLQLNASGYIPITPQVGATNGSGAVSGTVGQVIASDVPVGSAVSMTTATPQTITSVSLSAGDWTCSGSIATAPASTTTTSFVAGGFNTTTNILPATIEYRDQIQLAIAANTPYASPVPSFVENVSSTQTVYLVGQANFATSTMGMYGQMSCRRMR